MEMHHIQSGACYSVIFFVWSVSSVLSATIGGFDMAYAIWIWKQIQIACAISKKSGQDDPKATKSTGELLSGIKW